MMSSSGEVVDSDEGSSCAGCEWTVREAQDRSEYCLPDEDCYHHTCTPQGKEQEVPYTEVYLTKPGWDAERLVARWCLSEDEEVSTTADIGERVQDEWKAHAPEQDITVQPPGGRTLVNIETYLDSGQPAEMEPRTIRVLDFQVQLWAEGQWTWTVDDTTNPVVRRSFDTPGSRHDNPDPDVFHVYETTGTRQLQLTTKWWGSFRIGDNGPYDIETPATQTSEPIELEVFESRNALRDSN